MSYTPGPWAWTDEPSPDQSPAAPNVAWDGQHPREPWFDSLRGPVGELVAFGVWHNDDTAGIGAATLDDARLIAAAPELFSVLGWIGATSGDPTSDVHFRACQAGLSLYHRLEDAELDAASEPEGEIA